MSTYLGLAGTVEVKTFDHGKNLLRGYYSAAYLAIGFATASLILSAFFIRIPKDTREDWGADEGEKRVEMSERPLGGGVVNLFLNPPQGEGGFT